MKLSCLSVLLLTWLIFGSYNVAGQSVISDSTHILNEVIVLERSAKAPVNLLPLDVRIVDEASIENSSESNILPVLRNAIPGMFVTERGLAGFGVSGGSAGAVSIRGVGGGNKVLFMIDGQPQWAGVFGHALSDTYVTNDIQRVEVVSGPSSMLYGSGAMGGSVNLITRRASREGFNGSVRAMVGSYATQNYAFKAGFKRGPLRVFAAASYESSDGNRRGMDYWLANQFASVSYDFSSHWEAGVNAMFTETKALNPGSIYRSLPLDMWARQFRNTASFFVKNHYRISSGGFQAYYNRGKHDIDDGLDRQDKPRPYLFHSDDFNMGLTAYQTLTPWTDNNLSAGFDFKHWGGKAFNTSKTDAAKTPLVNKHVNEIAGYIMMQQALFRNILNLNAGVRLEHSSQFGNEWIPQAGFILRPLPSGRIKFNYGRGFRSPTIRELYMYAPRNPDLKPESLDNFEVELRQWAFDSRLNIGLALFYIEGRNMILTISTDQGQKNVNTGKFRNKGFEIDASFAVRPDLSISANYAYLHTDTRIVGAPKNKLFGEVVYSPGSWQFSVDMLNVWGLCTEESKENYSLLNARAAYRFDFKCPLTLFIKGENLTAADYQINYGFPMPRATVMAGVEWKF